MISVDEISRIREKRTRFRKELYTKIYEQVSRKIRNTVDVGGNTVVVLIPAFVLGFPSFDRYKATSYIIRQLGIGGLMWRYSQISYFLYRGQLEKVVNEKRKSHMMTPISLHS